MIRGYTPADLKTVFGIWLASSKKAHPFLKKSFVEKVEKDMLEIYIPNSETWVFEENDEVLGFVGMAGNEIGGLFVVPEEFSRGIGTQLVDYVKGKYGYLEVEVFEKNRIGRSFYKKYGFVPAGSYFHKEAGENVLKLTYGKE